MKNFPLTVSRYREDFREYEKENISNASYHNGIINIGNFFEKVIDNYGMYYKYKGIYFKIKNKKNKNIDLTNEEVKIWNREIFYIYK